MRSSSFARVVIAGLAVSVVITTGCDPRTRPSGMSIYPTSGPSVGATVVRISGIGLFQSSTTVTVDGSRVDATILNANVISLTMPAHAAGNVDLAVIRAPGQASVSVAGGYTYIGPPIISELLPNIGSTGGGTPIAIRGDRFWDGGVTVTVGGIKTPLDDLDNNNLYLSAPAHAAGTVEVIVTDRFGQTASGLFTYASPATFDVNGDWQGWAEDAGRGIARPIMLSIRDNVLVSVSCGSALTLEPPPVVANGEFAFAGGGNSITGKVLSPIHLSGSINTPSCSSLPWSAEKK